MEKLYGKDLAVMAYRARLLAVDAVHRAKSGHPGGSLSCLDALTTLYFNEMNVNPADPKWEDRDRFVLSKGHCAPALYAVLALRGYFPTERLQKLRSIDDHLSGHPDMVHVPGVDMSTGSLGQGQIWEAIMAAAKWSLDNLCVFIDVNGLQIDGATKNVMPTEPLDKKLEAFNWHVVKIDGHDYAQILAALSEARSVQGKHTAILMATHKGKGVSFMEDQAGWHGKAPNDDEFAIAKAELESKIKELEEN